VHSKTTESLSIKNPNYAGNGSIPIVVKNYIGAARGSFDMQLISVIFLREVITAEFGKISTDST
jgi:hypothetical protein